MDIAWVAAIVGGTIAANVLLATTSSWVRAIVEVRKAYPNSPWRMVFLTSLFNAGPWTLIIAGAIVYYEYQATWAPWFFGAALAWWIYICVLIVFAKRRSRRSGNAA